MKMSSSCKLNTIVLAMSIAVTGCGGGGGGGLSATLGGTVPSTTVPYYTPVKVGNAVMSTTPVAGSAVAGAFSKDLSNSGSDNLIVAGRNVDATRTSNQISVYGWSNGTLVDQTSQWFSGTNNVITGTEPDIEFADFNNDGRTDMYVAPSTDSEVTRGAPGVMFINNGSSFTRTDLAIGNSWVHDSVVTDFNLDGNADIFNIDFGSASSLLLGNGDGTFATYINDSATSSLGGASSVTAGDFLGNNTTSIVVTDASNVASSHTQLMTYSVSSGKLVLTTAKTLPVPRFDLPKYSQYDQYTSSPKSHTIRSFTFDFDASGIPSVVLITSPGWEVANYMTARSEVQFLKNDGSGNFSDVTDNVLVGYDTKLQPDYNPQLLDINGDGLTDIFLGGETWENDITNTAVLLQTAEHKYVYSFADVFTAFQNQSRDMESALAGTLAGGGQTSIIKGPNNTFYMVSMLSVTTASGTQEKAIYLSKIGAQTPTAQATAAAVKQAWPYLSDSAVNQVLASTSTTVFGLNEINLNNIFNPVGDLSLSGEKYTGYIAGINMPVVSTLLFDSFNRGFRVSIPTASTAHAWEANYSALDQPTRSTAGLQLIPTNGPISLGLSSDSKAFSVGTGVRLNKNTYVAMQGTTTPYSPFVSMSGSWGKVTSSFTNEVSVVHNSNNWIGKAGIMHTRTNITPGLVTSVSPITSLWGEGGYNFGSVKLLAGILPKVVNGSVNMSVPTSVDLSGKVHYTNLNADIQSPTVKYIRLAVDEKLSKQSTVTANMLIADNNNVRATVGYKLNF